jgi:DNA polymerase-3 subunit alpha
MAASPFVHLHVHSELSLVDGTLRIPELVERAREMGMPAVALTDHGNLFGLVRFYQAALDAGIKPIIGAELWLAPEGNQPAHHLVVLARDRTGYANLVKLVSRGYLEGQHKGQPRVAKEWLREHGAGLIGLSANLEGEVGYWLARGRDSAAEEAARFYADALPAGFYLELQRTGREGQEAVNQASLDLARRLDLPVVATNNVHFADSGDVEAHEVRTAIAEGTTLERRRGPRRFTEQNHLRTPDDMAALFEDIPEAVTNAGHLAARCTVPLEFGTPYLPDYQPPGGQAIEEYFPEAARSGLEERFPQILARESEERHAEVREQYQRRLEHEIAIIDQMGFPAYFLIVADFIQWAKDNDVPVGPGRGSGAGSLVAFALKITDIDPIRYGLLFERFLNPERVSMPDFDVDFCMEKRDRVIDYVADKYGRDKVAQIITFGAMKAKAVVRDVGRVMGHPFGYVDKIAKLVPNDLGVTLDDALKQEDDLRNRYENEEDVHTLIEHGRRLEGLARNAGTHAGGVVISPSALTDFTPLFKEADGDTVTTQFDKDDVEEAGLVKFDFLGLRTLTVIDKAVAQVNRTRAAAGEDPLDLDALPMDDEATFELLRRCETTAVFQLESSGMKELIQRLQPERFEDLVALVALYRPGPLESGMVDDYVERRHGRQTNWSYPHPWLEDILKETYGVILYQEQVMQIAQVLGNYSLGAADLLRRAMGKKKAKEMAKQRETFLNGARENGLSEEQATYIFDLMEKFAGYGFNKCVHGDTRVMDADTGHWYRVEDLFWNGERPRVHACDDELRLVPRPVQAVVWNGVKSVYRLRTRSGWTIRATANHPFRTFDGWTRLENLSVGDRIAAARRLQSSSEEHWPSHELIVLAGLLGEGNTCHPANLFFYNNDSELVDDFVRAAEQFPNTSARVSCYDGVRQEVCLKRLKAVPWNSPEFEQFRVSGARWWAEELGIVDHRATEKTVPEPVFRLADADIALFLGRLWSGDGSLNVQQTTPYFATSSPALADDVRRLLLRLGIFTVVHEKGFRYRGEIRSGYVVHLVGDDALKAFAEKVLPNVVGRQGEVEIFQQMADRAQEWTSRDTIPAQIRDRVADVRRQRGWGWGELEQRAGCSMKEFTGNGSAGKRGFRRSTVGAVAQALEDPEISAWAGSDLFWDEVAEIEYVGEFDTFDLQIEEHHNFVAEGTVVHNSHSGAYALLSYRTAYLKAHYPAG